MPVASSPADTGAVKRYGWRIERRTLVRKVRGSVHLLEVPPAISFDAAHYDRLRGDFDRLRVDDVERGWRYTIAAEVFDGCREFLDRGCGPQWYTRLERWTREPLPGHQLPLDPAP